MESKLAKSYDYFLVFIKVFSNSQEESLKIKWTSMDNTMKKCERRQMKYVGMNVWSVETCTPPSLGFWPKLVYAHGST